MLGQMDAVLLLIEGRAAMHGKPDEVANALKQRRQAARHPLATTGEAVVA